MSDTCEIFLQGGHKIHDTFHKIAKVTFKEFAFLDLYVLIEYVIKFYSCNTNVIYVSHIHIL